MKRLIYCAVLFMAAISSGASGSKASSSEHPLRLLYWNIQNGMWSGQPDGYDAFVDFVRGYDPDICVWCEAASIFRDSSADYQHRDSNYLPAHWPELAARYGHSYTALGGYRDNYPQIVTSRYPIETIDRIVGGKPDSVVCHGAGWHRIAIGNDTLNIVTLHTWPQRWGYGVPNDTGLRRLSAERSEGHRYRRMEMEYVCRHTIGTDAHCYSSLWMMMGDFNARSRTDNYHYGYPADTTAFLAHDYVAEATPYVDVVAARSPGVFVRSTGWDARIDFVYATPLLYNHIIDAKIIDNDYTHPVRDPARLSNFYHPSDHMPIVVDFDFRTHR